MNGDAEAARELDRLRTELLEFVVDALGERMANGDYAELSDRLVEAIDRRVDQAVAARLADTDWPDPDRFVDEVLAAAGGRAGDGEAVRSSRRPAPARRGGMTPLKIGLLMLGAVILTAAATYLVLQIWSGPTTTNVVAPIAPDPVFYDANGILIDPGNAATGNIAAPPPAAPAAAADAARNAQGPNP
jgi:hypothetical protein